MYYMCGPVDAGDLIGADGKSSAYLLLFVQREVEQRERDR